MNQLLERYLNGEHEKVWQDMLALGPLDRKSPVFKDFYAVAQETMSRAKGNILTIISRLEQTGYKFALPEQVYIPPGTDVRERLQQLVSHTGPIPVSLQAWYEIVGGVCLMGDHENLAFYSSPIAQEPPLFYSDPLVVFPIQAALGSIDLDQTNAKENPQDKFLIPIAPDSYHKANISGGAPYEIGLPCSAVDTILLNEWHKTTFVNYLRISFRWGGFPGWERYPDKPNALLKILSADLTTI
jgi:hypothetical protein